MNLEDSFTEFNDYFSSMCNFVVFHQNISSIRENYNSFVIYLNSLIKKPDVIVLSEIWIHTCETEIFNISGYYQFAKCNDSYRSGGVIVYISDKFTARRQDVTVIRSADVLKVTIDIESDGAGAAGLQQSLPLALTIVAAYRLHSYPINAFLGELTAILDACNDRNLMVIGDMNLCLVKQSAAADEYLSIMASFGLDQLIDTPTRGDSCLDHIFFRSRDVSNLNCQVISSGRSDHDVSVCELSFSEKYRKSSNTRFGDTKRLNYDVLISILEGVDWSTIYCQQNVSVGFKMFVDIILRSIEQAYVTISIKSKHKLLKPWMNVQLCKRISYRNLLRKKAKKRPDDRLFIRFFNSFSDKLRIDISRIKREYYHNLFEKNRTNIKKQWQTINTVVGKQKEKRGVDCIRSFLSPDNIISDKHSIADEFNNYFVSIVKDLLDSNELTDDLHSTIDFSASFPANQISKTFFCYPTDHSEIEACIGSLSNNKAPGCDGVSAATIKSIKKFILPVLSFLINLSFETGEFPSILKEALVIPIHKKGCIKELNNYRPISLLSVFSKIIEKIMKKRLIAFLNSVSFFSENQFGFMENKSTEDALLNFCSTLFEGLNKNKCTSGIFVDITKAFDSVNHNILFERLWEAGIRGTPLDWFTSYLTDRGQYVKIQDVRSSRMSVMHGVPQGSVLGPILFLIYINNLCRGNFWGSLTCFADDTALCYSASSDAQLWRYMQSDMDKLKYWFTLNKLVLASEKTKFIRFYLKHNRDFQHNIYYKCTKCLASNCNTCSNCNEIAQVNSIKYLGVIIDENCNWKEHVSKLKGYLNSALRTFYHLRQVCPESVLRTAYFSIVNSKLQYGIVCWGGTYLSTLRAVQVSQKKIIRVMRGAKISEPSYPLFKNLLIYPLRHLFVYRVLRIFFIRGGHLRGNTNVHSIRLQNLNRFPTPFPKIEAFKRYYTFCAPKLFNELPLYVTSANSLSAFLKRLQNWLFSVENIEIFF